MNDESLYVAGLVAYDGTDYHGYQYQKGVRTVQRELERALAEFGEALGRVSAAGRTDTGVHGNGQVVAVSVRWRHSVEKLQSAWNAHLSRDVCVRHLRIVPDGFHPRFSAIKRTYRYRIVHPNEACVDSPGRSPLTDRFTWYVDRPLDVVSMQRAASYLVGTKDFATFGHPTQGDSTTRIVYEARWQVVETLLSEQDMYTEKRLDFSISANGFLRQMVRSITGTLVEVGLGIRDPSSIVELVAGKSRSLSAPPAPARGLTLESVSYPDEYLFVNAKS